MADRKLVKVSGSKKVPLPGARIIQSARPDERLEVTVRLRPRAELPDASEMLNGATSGSEHLSHEEFEARYGADPKDIAKVRQFAEEHNLAVVNESSPRRSVMLSGTVADFNRAFGVDLKIYEHAEGTYRGREGYISIPAALEPVIEGVFGLDNRRVARPHFRPRRDGTTDGARAFNPDEVARLYNFPPDADGTGECIGIIELGGGYRPADLQTYFKRQGLKTMPKVIPVSVDGAKNSPTGDPNGDDGEVVLDIEVAGALAPGATIAVYFAPNNASSKGFLDAITKAVHDSINNPSVISISWGGPEQIPNDSFQAQFDQVLQAAALLGISVCVASGDDGAADEIPADWDGKAHVDFPASSPFALACGATRLIASGSGIKSESNWNQHRADPGPDGSFGAAGGGVSGAFALPGYQKTAGVPVSLNPAGKIGRGVPDVTGAGDPDTGYNVLVDGHSFPIGGTSAVAPLWAALLARINQQLKGRVGFINPQIYALSPSSGVFHDITAGDNRVSYKAFHHVGYDTQEGWDACCGLGSPNGVLLLNKLKATRVVAGHATKPREKMSTRSASANGSPPEKSRGGKSAGKRPVKKRVAKR